MNDQQQQKTVTDNNACDCLQCKLALKKTDAAYLSDDEDFRPNTTDDLPVDQLIARGETTKIEYKATLRVNLHTSKPDKKMEHSCLKTIAAFLNSHGGYLVVGVADNGEVLGIEKDGFPNEDKMNLHLVNLLKDRLGLNQAKRGTLSVGGEWTGSVGRGPCPVSGESVSG